MNDASARAIYIIRHGEKPPNPPKQPPPAGVDIDGDTNVHSLIPLGWQRAGALATLFAPMRGDPPAGLRRPDQLISPGYDDHTSKHRTYETIFPISQRIDTDIENPYAEGGEAKLGAKLAAQHTGVTLVCWEHHAIHAIANAIQPISADAKIPQDWPSDRFDVVLVFTWDGDQYDFTQVPQRLLAGDIDAPIPT
jgi:hypothetical protein